MIAKIKKDFDLAQLENHGYINIGNKYWLKSIVGVPAKDKVFLGIVIDVKSRILEVMSSAYGGSASPFAETHEDKFPELIELGAIEYEKGNYDH